MERNNHKRCHFTAITYPKKKTEKEELHKNKCVKSGFGYNQNVQGYIH